MYSADLNYQEFLFRHIVRIDGDLVLFIYPVFWINLFIRLQGWLIYLQKKNLVNSQVHFKPKLNTHKWHEPIRMIRLTRTGNSKSAFGYQDTAPRRFPSLGFSLDRMQSCANEANVRILRCGVYCKYRTYLMTTPFPKSYFNPLIQTIRDWVDLIALSQSSTLCVMRLSGGDHIFKTLKTAKIWQKWKVNTNHCWS